MSFSTSTYRVNSLPSIFWYGILSLMFALFPVGFIFFLGVPITLEVWRFSGLFTLPPFIVLGLTCYINSRSYLTTNNREIIYRRGWLNISTTTIDVRNVRSCSIEVGIVQGMFNASTITISTAGEDIIFSNVNNGELLYQQINNEISAIHS